MKKQVLAGFCLGFVLGCAWKWVERIIYWIVIAFLIFALFHQIPR